MSKTNVFSVIKVCVPVNSLYGFTSIYTCSVDNISAYLCEYQSYAYHNTFKSCRFHGLCHCVQASSHE